MSLKKTMKTEYGLEMEMALHASIVFCQFQDKEVSNPQNSEPDFEGLRDQKVHAFKNK